MLLRRTLTLLLVLACLPAAAQEKKPPAKPVPATKPTRPPPARPGPPAAAAPAEAKPAATGEGATATPPPATSTTPAADAAPAAEPAAEPTPAEDKKPGASPPAASASAEVSIPPVPADRIWDQTGTWSPDERKVAAAELNAAAVQLRFGIYLVNLNAAPDEQAGDLARRLAFGWPGAADRAVILTAPGLKAPVVECVGESLGSAPPEQVAALCSAAQAEAAKAPSGMPAALAAARSLVTQMTAFRTSGILGPNLAAAAVPEEAQGSKNGLLWLSLGAICIVLLLAAAFFMKRRQTSALIFPPVQFRRRFSAPHSGGSNALVQFGSAASREDARNSLQ